MSSVVLEVEISRNPDEERRNNVAALLAFATEVVVPEDQVATRAAFLQTLGFGAFDALHLASAEQAQVDVFLTTDDTLLRIAARHETAFRMVVQNPVSWYKEGAS